MVGDTLDTSLTGLPSGSHYPFAALSSIAIPNKYYWAKVLSLKAGISLYGVQFSVDGALLIAHTFWQNNESIVVFNPSTGAVLSARIYSSNGY